MSETYEIRSVPTGDLLSALRIAAETARSEGFPNVAERDDALALHIENAIRTVASLAGDRELRVQVDLVVRLVPNVNPVLRPEYWG
jgi:hypothetical protein